MNFYGDREKNALYYFGLICSIPHPSGHEKELAQTLMQLALENGCSAEMDHAGNLRIDRPAAKGLENSVHIILQGHLDMVPQAAPGKTFDFTKQPIELIEENGYLHANGTTLGADNGAGTAAALALLFDPELKAGPLSGLFTVSEEIGLIGANSVKPEFLKGDWLFNLDSGDYHNFCIGCAGGARLSFEIPLTEVNAPEGAAYRIQIIGLKGGHSGVNIHEKRGNSLILLCQFLQKIKCCSVCSIAGGSADNAIPSEAAADIISDLMPEQIKCAAEQFRKVSTEFFDAPSDYQIRIEPVKKPEMIIDPALMENFIALTATVPNGVFEYDPVLNIVKTSSNFASVRTDNDLMTIHTSQRSLEDPAREAMTERLIKHFTPLNGSVNVSGIYPGWPANAESEPIRFAGGIYQEIYGKLPEIYAIHAGLETGAFAQKNPGLNIISFGPMEEDIHTERERLNLEKYEEFNKLLRTIVERAANR